MGGDTTKCLHICHPNIPSSIPTHKGISGSKQDGGDSGSGTQAEPPTRSTEHFSLKFFIKKQGDIGITTRSIDRSLRLFGRYMGIMSLNLKRLWYSLACVLCMPKHAYYACHPLVTHLDSSRSLKVTIQIIMFDRQRVDCQTRSRASSYGRA